MHSVLLVFSFMVVSAGPIQYVRSLGEQVSDVAAGTCSAQTRNWWYYNTTSQRIRCCFGASPTWSDCGALSGTSGKVAYWDSNTTVAADDGMSYNATNNTLIVGPADGGVGIVINGQDTKLAVGKQFSVDTVGHVLSSAGTFGQDGGLAYSVDSDPGTGLAVEPVTHTIGFQSGLTRTFNMNTSAFYPDSAAQFSTSTSTYMDDSKLSGSMAYGFLTDTGKAAFLYADWLNGGHITSVVCNGASGSCSSRNYVALSHVTYTQPTNIYYPNGFRADSRPTINSGYPVFMFTAEGYLPNTFAFKTARCTSDECATSSAAATIVDGIPSGAGDHGWGVGVCDDGSLMFAWGEHSDLPRGGREIMYSRCTDLACTSPSARVNLTAGLTPFEGASLGPINVSCAGTVGSYHPVIQYGYSTPSVIVCSDMACSSISKSSAPYACNVGVAGPQVRTSSGITYFTQTLDYSACSVGLVGRGDYMLRCNTPECTSLVSMLGSKSVTDVPECRTESGFYQVWGRLVPFKTSSAAIAYLSMWHCFTGGADSTHYEFSVTYCEDSMCSIKNTIPLIVSSADMRWYTTSPEAVGNIAAVELPNKNIRIMTSYLQNNNVRFYDAQTGTLTVSGKSVGTTVNRVSDVYIANSVEVSNVVITSGALAGYGLLTLGQKTADPIGTSNAGTTYWNTTDNVCRIYNGSAWQNCAVGMTDLLIGGNAYTGSISVGTMAGYAYPAALRSNGVDRITVNPDGGVTVAGFGTGTVQSTSTGHLFIGSTPVTGKCSLYEYEAGTPVTLSVPTAGTYERWVSSSVGLNSGSCTATAGSTDSITLSDTGVWTVSFSVTSTGDSNNEFWWSAFLDGTQLPACSSILRLDASPRLKVAATTCLVSATAGQVLDLRVTAVDPASTALLYDVSLVAVR